MDCGVQGYLEKRSCQLFYYCVHMAEKTTSLCYVSFYVRFFFSASYEASCTGKINKPIQSCHENTKDDPNDKVIRDCFNVRCSVFHLGYVSLYVRCSVLDLPTRGSRVLCTCTADIVFSACSPRIRVRMCMCVLPSLELLLA